MTDIKDDAIIPEEDPIEKLKEEISKQDDAVQILVKPLNDNPTNLYSEEILQSKKLNKAVRNKFFYKDVVVNGKVNGRALANYSTEETEIQEL
ncbi:MAG: hypothetical protein WDA06_05835 [Phenylobacterium sp.]